ncbi:TIGR03364 family FAD-dependent oxidoreductase [Flavihumibacter profundi]|uniref:TIGR03364 family FAD-dependent oxidoreductase n=1 Tax=Flavihumibacter profundi TaxID=2716883 RepID=UPI001CC4C292|nr:TIGR03364 family FAD-dependent oxidoreductase [Flavihumibacter profundi]MBZ5857645.1 TIGR03364 family FAD-dependent oxidoreductase [Flavihumibacter profundi]
MNSKHYDCIITGAGVLGSFHAYHAARKGLKVLLLEKDSQPTDATVRNFGMAIPSGLNQGKWSDYGVRSLEIYKDIQSEFDLSVRKNGSMYIASDATELTLLEELSAINKKMGYPSVITGKESCLEKYPGLRASYCMGGLFFPEEITVEPDRMIHRLIAFMQEQLGLIYRPYSLVKSVVYRNDRCFVETSDGREFTADKVLICNGRDFTSLYPELFAKSDIVVTKLQMMRTSPMTDFVLPGAVLGGLSIRRYESFQECPSYEKLNAATINEQCKKWGIHVLFKQAADGSLIIGDSHEYEDARNADRLGFDVKQVINDIILQEAQRIFDLPHWNITTQWNGYYAQRKEHDIFMETADTNTWIITAIGGKGMTVSAGLAEANIHKIFA